LYDRENRLLASNDNWGDSPANANAIAAAAASQGAFAWSPGSADAALLITLPPGAYTAVVRGVGNTTGIATVETYDVSVD
jgi:hypothetical protein